MNWPLLAGSLVAVLALAGMTWMLGLGKMPPMDTTTAIAVAEERMTGFHAREALVSQDGLAALVTGDGEVAMIKRHGADFAFRRQSLPLQLANQGHVTEIETGEMMFGRLRLVLGQEDQDKLLTLM